MLFFNRSLQHSPASIRLLAGAGLVVLSLSLSQCTTSMPKGDLVVSVKDQKLGVYNEGKKLKEYVISTSKFGIGDQTGSYRTPLGKHEIIAKIGQGLPAGAVLKSRRWNGEVLKPNAPGRDPIVSRILWLRGTETTNRNAFNRCIYIHGTTEENRLGTPASYGCVRMGMKDVVDLFNNVNVGAKVVITKDPLPTGIVEKKKKTPEAEATEGTPAADAAPIEIAKLVPTEGEKQRAQDNAAKERDKAGPEKPDTKTDSKSKSKSQADADAKVAGKSSSKSKARA